MNFGSTLNTPAVLRVRWSPNCSIPFHYHPIGAIYFIQYGKMYFDGDGLDEPIALEKGDCRWVRAGFSYGPEYNSLDEEMEITVLGTERPPQFCASPYPYKLEKTVKITQVIV